MCPRISQSVCETSLLIWDAFEVFASASPHPHPQPTLRVFHVVIMIYILCWIVQCFRLTRWVGCYWKVTYCCNPLLSLSLLLLFKPSATFPEGRPGMSDVSSLSGISGLSFDSTLLSPRLFFCRELFLFLSYLFFCLQAHSPDFFFSLSLSLSLSLQNSSIFFVKR